MTIIMTRWRKGSVLLGPQKQKTKVTGSSPVLVATNCGEYDLSV